MPQGDLVPISDPAVPIEVSFSLRYARADVDRLPNARNFAAVRFGGLAGTAEGGTIEIPGSEIADPAFRKVEQDDQSVTVRFSIQRTRYEQAVDGRILLYCEYCRGDGSTASPENDRLLLGFVKLLGVGGPS